MKAVVGILNGYQNCKDSKQNVQASRPDKGDFVLFFKLKSVFKIRKRFLECAPVVKFEL